MPQHVGDDRVLTNELLRSGWRTVYQATPLVETDAPSDWPTFWRQQLRWGRSSQRETLLSLRVAVAPAGRLRVLRRPTSSPRSRSTRSSRFAVAHVMSGDAGATGLPLAIELPLGYLGMLASIGVRQVAHVRRVPGDLARLPLFVLQITFVLVPIRVAAFATMFHQGWSSRSERPAVAPAPAGLLSGESAP